MVKSEMFLMGYNEDDSIEFMPAVEFDDIGDNR